MSGQSRVETRKTKAYSKQPVAYVGNSEADSTSSPREPVVGKLERKRASGRRRSARYRERKKAELKVLRDPLEYDPDDIAILASHGPLDLEDCETDEDLSVSLSEMIHNLAEVIRRGASRRDGN